CVAQAAGFGEGDSFAADHQDFHTTSIQAIDLSRNEDKDREMPLGFEAPAPFWDEDAWEDANHAKKGLIIFCSRRGAYAARILLGHAAGQNGQA
ncbi:MAG: hypothetical protein RBT72_03180, partial [Spirochaetia bacterium]|nr:hypothetical protein [Spirochaetia bacterium]